MVPLVSAIMPTRNRPDLAAQAVSDFLRQTWPNKELVIVDDHMERSFPHGIAAPGIVYTVAPRLTVGAKRNMAIGRASGEVIMHWDDDDLYAPARMAEQVSFLLETDADMVGFHAMEFVDTVTGQRWQYVGDEGYCIGVSQTYWRETWEARPFRDVNQGEDNEFQACRDSATCAANGLIIARIHPHNTCRKEMHADPIRWRRAA